MCGIFHSHNKQNQPKNPKSKPKRSMSSVTAAHATQWTELLERHAPVSTVIQMNAWKALDAGPSERIKQIIMNCSERSQHIVPEAGSSQKKVSSDEIGNSPHFDIIRLAVGGTLRPRLAIPARVVAITRVRIACTSRILPRDDCAVREKATDDSILRKIKCDCTRFFPSYSTVVVTRYWRAQSYSQCFSVRLSQP